MGLPSVAELLRVQRDYAIASWGPFFIVIWRVETTVPAVREVRRTSHAFGETQPRGAGFITIVEAGAPVPKPAAREELATCLKECSPFMKASIVVYEGSGFRAAAVRGVVTGLTLLARQSYPHRVFGSVSDGAAWLVNEVGAASGEVLSAAELMGAIDDVRRRIGARAQPSLES